jgi:hypothetical protein
MENKEYITLESGDLIVTEYGYYFIIPHLNGHIRVRFFDVQRNCFVGKLKDYSIDARIEKDFVMNKILECKKLNIIKAKEITIQGWEIAIDNLKEE